MAFFVFGESGGAYSYDNVLPNDDYDIVVLDVEEGQSKSSGDDMITLHLGAQGPEGGVRFKDYIPCTEKMWWKVEKMLAAIHPEIYEQAMKVKEAGGEGADFDVQLLKGKTFRGRVKNETFNDEERPKMSAYLGNIAAPKEEAPKEKAPF